jgi:threonine dehydratase
MGNFLKKLNFQLLKLKIKKRYDHPDILAGQGTCALEIIESVPGLF